MDQRLRLNAKCVGCGEEVGFVRGEKIKHGLMGGVITDRRTQAVGRQPGQREEAFGAVAITQNPTERRQCERSAVVLLA